MYMYVYGKSIHVGSKIGGGRKSVDFFRLTQYIDRVIKTLFHNE